MVAKSYYHIVRCAPFTIIFISVVVTGLAVLTIFVSPPPDIRDPIKGSEARGTKIKGEAAAIQNFIAANVSYIPKASFGIDIELSPDEASQLASLAGFDMSSICLAGYCTDRYPLANSVPMCNVLTSTDKFSLVYTSPNGESLYTVEALKAMCEYGRILRNTDNVNQECPTHTVGTHIAKMTGTSCDLLRQSDLDAALRILRYCLHYVAIGALSENCLSNSCPGVPRKCLHEEGSIYIILTYLVDAGFVGNPELFLTYAQIIVPLYDAVGYNLPFYRFMQTQAYDSRYLMLVGADEDVKPDLYGVYIQEDLLLFPVAMAMILILMYLYTRSIMVTAALVFDVVFSYGLAYFIYFTVFRFTFFPFLNLLAALLVIGLAADDIFLFYDMWLDEKRADPNADIATRLSRTFSHAALSIFITSFTTGAALYSNVFSNITLIKCFSVFGGTAILCNFVMVITFIPAVVIIEEQIFSTCLNFDLQPAFITKLRGKFHDMKCWVFDRAFPFLINKLYPLWLGIFFLIAAGGFIAVYYEPRLKLPASESYQLLDMEEPVENFAFNIRQHFYFDIIHDSSSSSDGLPTSVVWGLVGEDTGNPFDPDDIGELVYDTSMDISSREAQTYLVEFCAELKRQPFLANISRQQPCTIDLFNKFMLAPCYDASKQLPCCAQRKPPFSPSIFRKCFPKFINELFSNFNPIYFLGKPYFNENDEIVVFMMIFKGNQEFVFLYDEMDRFYKTINQFIEKQKSVAPPGVDKSFIVTFFRFYDLQKSLIAGTYAAFGISVAIAFVVVLVTTRNIVTSIYSMTTITFAIFVTVGILAMAGWELNVLESIILSISVGLSIDFAIHYSVAYLLSEKTTRDGKVQDSLSRVGSPVAMAALTTFLAGIATIPAHVRGYQQLGEFLMVVMAVSWFYATFFFQSLCRCIGPLNKTGQFPLPKCCTSETEAENTVKSLPLVWTTNGPDGTGSPAQYNGAVPNARTTNLQQPASKVRNSHKESKGQNHFRNGDKAVKSNGNEKRNGHTTSTNKMVDDQGVSKDNNPKSKTKKKPDKSKKGKSAAGVTGLLMEPPTVLYVEGLPALPSQTKVHPVQQADVVASSDPILDVSREEDTVTNGSGESQEEDRRNQVVDDSQPPYFYYDNKAYIASEVRPYDTYDTYRDAYHNEDNGECTDCPSPDEGSSESTQSQFRYQPMGDNSSPQSSAETLPMPEQFNTSSDYAKRKANSSMSHRQGWQASQHEVPPGGDISFSPDDGHQHGHHRRFNHGFEGADSDSTMRETRSPHLSSNPSDASLSQHFHQYSIQVGQYDDTPEPWDHYLTRADQPYVSSGRTARTTSRYGPPHYVPHVAPPSYERVLLTSHPGGHSAESCAVFDARASLRARTRRGAALRSYFSPYPTRNSVLFYRPCDSMHDFYPSPLPPHLSRSMHWQ